MKKVLWFLLVASFKLSAEHPAPGSVTIQDVRYQGSGCRPGSVSTLLSPDNQAITLLFDNYIVDSSESRAPFAMKNCNVSFSLSAPPGWEYSLFCIDYRGYADLQEGTKGFHTSQYSFGNSARPVRLGKMELEGPFADDYAKTVLLPESERGWSSCGSGGNTVLRINTQLSVTQDLAQLLKKRIAERRRGSGHTDFVRPEGLLTVDSLDGHVKEHYGIEWRRCKPTTQPRRPGRPGSRGGLGRRLLR